MRVLVDTNLYIAYLLKPHPDHFVSLLLEAAESGHITLLAPEALLTEIGQTVKRKPHLLELVTVAWLDRFLSLLEAICEAIPRLEEPIPPITRDPKDDYLLAYAIVGQADYLVSGDKDLLDLPPLPQVQIVNSAQFRQILHHAN